MAWIAGDSFDYYGSNLDLPHSVWDSTNSGGGGLTTSSGNGTRFGVGQGYQIGTLNDQFTKTFGSNESTLYVAVAHYKNGALGGTTIDWHIVYKDGANNQCTICFVSDGSIVLRAQWITGTVLATFPGAYSGTLWTQWQIRVVIDGAAGEIRIRKNGSVTDTFVATGLNTRGGSANNYATNLSIGGNGGHFIDDLLFFSASGAAPNTWVGDVRAICLGAAAETAQKQFGSIPATPTATFGHTPTGGSSYTVPANTLVFSGPFRPTQGGITQKITTVVTGALTGHMKLALYAADGAGGLPGTLITTTAAMTNPTGSTDFTIAGGPGVGPAGTYYIAYLTDAAWNSTTAYLTGGAPPLLTLAGSYATGFPASVSGVTTTATLGWLDGIVTQTGQSLVVSEPTANGDTDYVLSSTVNTEDLYTVDRLPVTPFAIIGVVSKVYIRKSDAGTRQGQLRVKSGATEVFGVDTAVSSTYAYLARVDTVDPNTSAAWTLAALTALQIGQKVTV